MADLFEGISAQQLREVLERVEREEKAALTKVGLEFFTELVSKHTCEPSKSEKSDWHGFRVPGLGFNVDGKAFSATIVVTDVKATEAAATARKEAEKALKEAARKAADIQKTLDSAKGNPEKMRALRETLEKAGIQVPEPATSQQAS